MTGTFDTISAILGSAVANGGTFTVGYPTNRDPGSYSGGINHLFTSNAYGEASVVNGRASFSFGAALVTITNNTGATLAAGTEVFVQLDRPGEDNAGATLANPGTMAFADVVRISLGAPDVADADGVCASQSGTAATAMTIDGALSSGGVATFDVPRNVVAAWTGTAVVTVTGTDEYGAVVVESSASGTSLAGKKAFKTVTSVVPSANITSATVGTGDVLGLPVFLKSTGLVLRELQDGAAATAGTLVAGVTTAATATTGDVRGTYDPNAAANGALAFELIAALSDVDFKGVAQFAG